MVLRIRRVAAKTIADRKAAFGGELGRVVRPILGRKADKER